MACSPDEQNRLMVIAETVTGNPARSAAIRATFMPCSASGVAQPMITSSISATSSPFARATASLIAAAPRSSGRVARRVPLGAFPTAVRTELTITASRMAHLARCGRLRRPKLLHWMPGKGKKQPRAHAALRKSTRPSGEGRLALSVETNPNRHLRAQRFPSSVPGSYFQRRSASVAATLSITGPASTFVADTFPLLSIEACTTTSPSTPASCAICGYIGITDEISCGGFS